MDEITAARQAAQHLWQTWHATCSPAGPTLGAVPVAALAETLGVAVDYFVAAQEPDTMGYLDPTDDLIWLSDGLAPAIERFTLAHELGHWCLHRTSHERSNCAVADISHSDESQEPAALARPTEAYSPRSRREREANAFAAELLAPLTLIRQAYLGLDGTAPCTIEQLATMCQVSKAVIVAQLTRLLAGGIADNQSAPVKDVEIAGQPMPRKPDLDSSQRAAVTAPTPTLVVAGPGTGKTSTLVARVNWLVGNGARPSTILALTFSRKAAHEMRERIAAALGSMADSDMPTVTTFHQFCGDLLRSYGYLVGLRPDFRLIDQIAAFFLLRDLGGELPLNYYTSLAAPTRYFGDLISAISQAKDELVAPDHYRELALGITDDEARAKALEVAAVYAAYQAELARRQDADYGDLIRLAVRLFTEHPQVLATVQRQYAHLLVDEFQDINRANGVLLRQLAGPDGNIWAVGDANQAIYRFRGASPANIANFCDEYPHALVTPLEQNYRSRPAIVAAANRFAAATLQDGSNPAFVQLTATRPDQPDQIILRIAPDASSEIAAIAADIARRHEDGTPWGDHAILCRTRALARHITAALQAAAIPAEAQADLFADEHIKDTLGIVHLLAGETGGLLRAARMPDHPLSATTVQVILAALRSENASLTSAIKTVLASDPHAAVPSADASGLPRLQQALQRLQHQPTISQALATYLFELTMLARTHLAAGDETTRHLAELLALAGRFDEDATDDAPLTSPRRWQSFIAFLRAVRTLPREAAPATDAAPRDQVHVLTVHGAKGLEWPVVYLPKLAVRYFPTNNQYDAAPPPPGLVASANTDPRAEHLMEEACLFYVALTRARDTLILSRAERYSQRSRANPSPFLQSMLHQSDVHIEMLPSMPETAVSDAEDDGEPLALPTTATPAFVPPEALTTSALATYDRCPRQYAYRYGYRFAGGHNAYSRLRRAVADALRDAARPASDTTHALAIFEETWHADAIYHADDTAPDPFDALYLRHGRHAVATAFQQVRGPQQATAADIIHTVNVAVAETIIRVELDRTEALAATVDAPRRVVRHQMGHRPINAPDPNLAVYFQVLAQRTLSHDDHADTIAEHHLNTGEMVDVTLKPKHEEKLRAQAFAAIAGIRAASFPARPEERKCAGCEFVLICPS